MTYPINNYHSLEMLALCRFIEERHRTLGPDLATAHFAVARQATVKFVGIDDWVKIEDPKQKYVNLPGNYVPDLYLEAVDASGTQMLYESFDNFGKCIFSIHTGLKPNYL